MKQPSRILFIKTSNSSFIRRDETILRSRYRVDTFFFNTGKPKPVAVLGIIASKIANLSSYLFSSIRLALWFLWNQNRSKIIFVWFADYHALVVGLLVKIFRKELLIAIGGYDAVWIPEHHYGVYDRPFRRFCVRYGLNRATHLLPVDTSLVENINTYSGDSPRRGGIRHFNPNLKANIQVIPTGYEIDFWLMDHQIKKENLVVTAGYIADYRTFKIKGIDYFIQTASQLPEFQFVVIGAEPAALNRWGIKIESSNVDLIPQVPHHEIRRYFQRARVYAQFSLTEGMPNALCEAMLCECVPVGSNVGAIPNLIGNTGFIVTKPDVDQMARAVRLAMQSDSGRLARQRIAENFPLEKRAQALYRLIDSLLHGL